MSLLKYILPILLTTFILSVSDTHDPEFEKQFQVKHIKEGDGKNFPGLGDTIKMHYAGKLLSGKEFDSSYGSEPFEFPVGIGFVIKCWDIVSERMSVGEKITVVCPSDLAYGERGAGNEIPPNSDLLFEMELLEIVERYEHSEL